MVAVTARAELAAVAVAKAPVSVAAQVGLEKAVVGGATEEASVDAVAVQNGKKRRWVESWTVHRELSNVRME